MDILHETKIKENWLINRVLSWSILATSNVMVVWKRLCWGVRFVESEAGVDLSKDGYRTLKMH